MTKLDKITNSDTYACVYLMVNRLNGMIYVGQASNLINRYKAHKRFKHGQRLKEAIQTHGFETFDWYVLEKIEAETKEKLKELLTQREQYYLDLLRPYEPSIGYNICLAADSTLGYKHTESTKQHLCQAFSKRDFNGSKNPMYGKPREQSVKDAVSRANKGKVTQRRPIKQLDKTTGEVIKLWGSVAEASAAIGISITHIAAAARGHKRWIERYQKWYCTNTAGGYKWVYDGEILTGRWDKSDLN